MALGRFFRRKSKENYHPRPPWVKWVLGIFLLYILFQGFTADRMGMPQTPVQQALKDAGKSFSTEKAFDFSSYKKRIFPEYGAAIHIRDIKPGTGQAAICGQTVRIAYKVFHEDHQPVNDSASKDNPLSFTIGSGKAMPVFEQGVIGMRVGGTRSLQTPMSMAYGVKGFARKDILSNEHLRFEVTLLSVSPKTPDLTRLPFRIANIKAGYGPPLTCGKEAHLHLIVWDLAGHKLYTTLPDKPEPAKTDSAVITQADTLPEGIRFIPGRSQVMFGLERGVLGMNPGSMRTLIIPPELQKTLSGKPPVIAFPLPENQTILVDVEYLP